MAETIADTIQNLCDSYRIQQGLYRELGETVHRILSKLILSRGDLTALRADFEDKQRLLEDIETQRFKIAPQVKIWQESKAGQGETAGARELDSILRDIEKSIKSFLDGEDQLKKHLERIMQKGKKTE